MSTHYNLRSNMQENFMRGSSRKADARVLVLLVLLTVSATVCAAQASHTLTLNEGATSPKASIADVSWMAGHWSGPAFGGVCDEIWSPPSGNAMMGMFRLVKDDKTVFYELMAVVEEDSSLVMKLKHFNSQLIGWEEKGVVQSFPLVKLGPDEAFFSGLTYRKQPDGALQIFLATKDKSGAIIEEEFRLRPFSGMKIATTTSEQPSIKTHALKINVDDMQKALAFYVNKLGFEIEDNSNNPQTVSLKTGDRIKLILNRVPSLQRTGPKDTQVGLTLQVNDITQTIGRLKTAGVDFEDSNPRQEAVGKAVTILDPFGRRISLMHQTVGTVEPFKEPRIYNFGLLVPNMDVARAFYADRLGFVVRSEKYLPLDLPLGHQDKSFGFMLHYRKGVRAITSNYPESMPYYTIVFETSDLQKAGQALTRNGIEVIKTESSKNSKPTLVFKDPFGNISEMIEH